jgi:predicted RNase H-like nuclease (RuvC/YqgF family)
MEPTMPPKFEEPPSLLREIMIKVVPILLTVIISVTGAYIALNSQVAGLAVEVGRLGKIVDRMDEEGKQTFGLAAEVKKLTTAVEKLNGDSNAAAIRDVQATQDRAELTKLKGDVQSLVAAMSDARMGVKLLERELETLRRDLRKGRPDQ